VATAENCPHADRAVGAQPEPARRGRRARRLCFAGPAVGGHSAGRKPVCAVRQLIVTVPGISTGVADVIIAETRADMTRFPTPDRLASWAGTCPGSNESAGRIKSTKTRPANPYLEGAFGIAALSAARDRGTNLAAGYRRIAPVHHACRGRLVPENEEVHFCVASSL
jgi:transposase